MAFLLTELGFQFPSNGNADTKVECGTNIMTSIVEFQFPSNGNADTKLHLLLGWVIIWSFNSLQTGKPITRMAAFSMILNGVELFQFPSNGKAYHKLPGEKEKRSSPLLSFNSLQTGTRITSKPYLFVGAILSEFQFPSNGNAYHKKTEKNIW